VRARGRKQCSIVKLHTASKVAPQKVGRRLAGRVETIAQARGGEGEARSCGGGASRNADLGGSPSLAGKQHLNVLATLSTPV